MTPSALLGAIVAAGVGLAIATVSWRRRFDPEQDRRERMRRLAHDMGWSFSGDDVFDHGAMDFAVFGPWRGRAANVLVGTGHDGSQTCVFDHVIPAPATETGTARFSCVLTDLPTELPGLLVIPRFAETRLLDPTALGDLPLEDPAFDDTFRVHTANPRFAHSLLDTGMRHWLIRRWPVAGFEIRGSLLLVWGPAQPPRRTRDVISASDDLRGRIPREAWTMATDRGDQA